MTEENNCHFLSSRGILKSCDVYSLHPISSDIYIRNYNVDLLETNNNAIIYVCNRAIPYFIKTYNLQYKYILVSGDADETVPYNIFHNTNELLTFLYHPNLIHWYSQNCVIDHPKMTRMPIGLDYHTILNNPSFFWKNEEEGHFPKDQESILYDKLTLKYWTSRF